VNRIGVRSMFDGNENVRLGNNIVNVNTDNFITGNYFYTVSVNGIIITTGKISLVK
jgi:hypothetical protein